MSEPPCNQRTVAPEDAAWMASRLREQGCEIYDLRERLENAERRLRQLGYVRCDMIACNCKGYHFNGES